MKRIALILFAFLAFSLSMADDAPKKPTSAEPLGYVTIDLRPVAFTFNPLFINPEVPTAVVPKGWGVKIIMPAPVEADSGCNAAQTKGCKYACARQRQALACCEVQFDWPPDGSAPTRTVICTCMDPNSPQVAGSVIATSEIRLKD